MSDEIQRKEVVINRGTLIPLGAVLALLWLSVQMFGSMVDILLQADTRFVGRELFDERTGAISDSIAQLDGKVDRLDRKLEKALGNRQEQ